MKPSPAFLRWRSLRYRGSTGSCAALLSRGPSWTPFAHYDVRLWTDNGVLDLMNNTHMVMANLEGTTKGDGAAIALKEDTLGGRIQALTPKAGATRKRDFRHHAAPRDTRRCSWTCRTARGWPRRGPSCPASQTRQPSRPCGPCSATAARAARSPTPWPHWGFACEMAQGELGRVSSYRRSEAMYRVLTPEIARLHRTGEWPRLRSTTAPIRTAGGRELQRQPDGRRGVQVPGRLEVPQINGFAWGVEPTVWKRVVERFERERKQTAAERGGLWSYALMRQSPMFWTAGKWHRFFREHSTLQIRYIDGGTPTTPPEWDPTLSTLVASVNYVRAWNLIGKAIVSSAALAGARLTEVNLARGTESGPVRTLRAELVLAEAQAQESAEDANTAGKLAASAEAAGHAAAARAQLAEQDLHLTAAEQAGHRQARLRLELEQAIAEPPQDLADLTTPLAVGVALMRWDGQEDRELKNALRALCLVENMKGAYDPHSGQIEMVTGLEVVLEDGRVGTVPVQVRMPNTSNKRPIGVADSRLVSLWAQGSALGDLAVAYGRTERWVRHAIYRWLAARGTRTMAPALVDNQVLVTRQAVVATLEPKLMRMPNRMSNGERLTRATIELLVAPYLNDAAGSWGCWTGYSHARDRRLINVLRAAGGQADVLALAEAAGADPSRLSKPFGNRPALTTTPGFAMRRLRECPHPDCASKWASHVLYVPETAQFGVLCPGCLRFPDVTYKDAPLPLEYATKWDRALVDGREITLRAAAADLRLPQPAVARVAGDLIRAVDVARILGVQVGTVAPLRNRGVLPESLVVGNVRLWRRSTCEAHAAQRSTVASTAIKDGNLSPAQAATRLGVAEHRVRQYVEEGLLAYRRLGRGPSSRVRIKPSVVAAFTPPAGDLLVAMTVADVCRRSGRSRAVVLEAMGTGELGSVPSTSGQARVLPQQYDAWSSRLVPVTTRPPALPDSAGTVRPDDGRLSVSATAAALGLSPKQVRRLAEKGELDDHRDSGRGWRWFDWSDVCRYRDRTAGPRPSDG